MYCDTSDVPSVVADKEEHPSCKLLHQRLATSMYRELRRIRCALAGGVLTLDGRVSTFYLRQVVISLAEGLDGVARIDDRLVVADRRTPLPSPLLEPTYVLGRRVS